MKAMGTPATRPAENRVVYPGWRVAAVCHVGVRIAKESGREHWQIWHLFAFRPEVTGPLASFTEGVMRAPAPIGGGLRELIATYTSWTNRCEFCWRSHPAVAAEMLGSEALARQVLDDVETLPLPENEKALLRFARKITMDLPAMREADVEELRSKGWNDEAIYFTILVVALFNFLQSLGDDVRSSPGVRRGASDARQAAGAGRV